MCVVLASEPALVGLEVVGPQLAGQQTHTTGEGNGERCYSSVGNDGIGCLSGVYWENYLDICEPAVRALGTGGGVCVF